MIDVAVIIVNYKMKDDIRESLKTLFRDIQGAPCSVKAVVVDNASGDGVGEMLEKDFPEAVFLQNGENLGYGAAVNNAIRFVPANFYFVLNPDTRFIEPKTIERLWEYMHAHPKIGVCAPKLVNTDGSLQYSCCRFPRVLVPIYRRTPLGESKRGKRELNRFLMRDWAHDEERLVDWVLGSAMFVRGSALGEVGLMDDRFFMYFEDTDWCRRFWNARYPVMYVPSVKLMHEHMRASAKMPVWKGVFLSKTTQYHVASWIKYLIKYRGQQI